MSKQPIISWRLLTDLQKKESDPIRYLDYRARKNRSQRIRNAKAIALRPPKLGPYIPSDILRKIRQDNNYQNNKHLIMARSKVWKKKNPEKVRASNRKYVASNYDKVQAKWLSEEAKASCREYQRKLPREVKRKRARDAMARMKKTDPMFRVLCNLRRRVNDFIRGNGKSASTMALIGTDRLGLMKHIEMQFLPGMTWDNYGKVTDADTQKWHVDHIIPCAWFNLDDPNQQRSCFNYANLQPLWGLDNISKNARFAA